MKRVTTIFELWRTIKLLWDHNFTPQQIDMGSIKFSHTHINMAASCLSKAELVRNLRNRIVINVRLVEDLRGKIDAGCIDR